MSGETADGSEATALERLERPMVAYAAMCNNVVVTGTGCVSSLGIGTRTFVDALLAGESGIARITTFSTVGCRAQTAALIRDFDPARYIDPAKLRRIDEVGRLALSTCRLALEDASLPAGTSNVGVALGTATSGIHSRIPQARRLLTDGPATVPALGFSNTIGNAAASLCALEFALHGPNVTLAQKQASALAAIAFAVSDLRHGRAAAYVSGGNDDFEEEFYRIHDRLRVLSPGNGSDEASRPFDARRNGFVLGAGGYALVLELASSAEARGVPPYGEILGVGATSSACALNGWPDEPSGIVRAMRAALADAEVAPAEVAAVFASANSTVALDRAEAQAIAEVFGPAGVPVVSVKGALGEFGASGAAALLGALLCLGRGRLPPTVGFEQGDPECPVDVSPDGRGVNGRVAVINATADGGAHYSLVVRSLGRRPIEGKA